MVPETSHSCSFVQVPIPVHEVKDLRVVRGTRLIEEWEVFGSKRFRNSNSCQR